MIVYLQLPTGGGLLGSIAQMAVAAGTLLLLMMLVALGVYAYKNLRGDGIEWPDEQDKPAGDSLEKGGDEDEWDYY